MKKDVEVLFAHSQSENWDRLRSELVARSSNYHVNVVNSFRDLVRTVETVCMDIILLDWEMPGKTPQLHVDFITRTCPQSKLIVLVKNHKTILLAKKTDVEVVIYDRECSDDLWKLIDLAECYTS